MAETKATVKKEVTKQEDVKSMSFLQRLTSARHWVANQEVKKSGFNNFTNASYYELSDFIQPILDSQVKYNLFSTVSFDYEKSIAYLHVYDSTDSEVSPLVFNFRFVNIELSKGNLLQAEGAIQTYCRRYLYLSAWEITESDFSEMDPDAKIDKKRQAADEAKKAEEDRKALILKNKDRLNELIPLMGLTIDGFIKKHTENYKGNAKDIADLSDQQIAGYVTLFETKLKSKK